MKIEAPTTEMVLTATSHYFGVPVDLLCNYKNRCRHIAYPRHLAMYLAYELTFQPQFEISKVFKCNRSAITYAVKQIQFGLNTGAISQDINAITKRLK
jgi:chromosomal replication initiation ATPase DnaA